MIVGRRHHATRIADADALQDLQAAKAKVADASLDRGEQRATAQLAQSGRDRAAGDDSPKG